jgi:hypothetical protein
MIVRDVTPSTSELLVLGLKIDQIKGVSSGFSAHKTPAPASQTAAACPLAAEAVALAVGDDQNRAIFGEIRCRLQQGNGPLQHCAVAPGNVVGQQVAHVMRGGAPKHHAHGGNFLGLRVAGNRAQCLASSCLSIEP